MPSKAKKIIKWGADILKKSAISESYQNSELLLCYALEKPKLYLRLHPETRISDRSRQKFEKLINLKKKGLPLSYIVGTHNFMGIVLKVNKNVLIPRPETEDLTEKVLDYMKKVKKTANLLELGTGSGAICSTLAIKCAKIKITATDICPKALETAKSNAKRLKVNGKIKFILSDLFDKLNNKFDLIVSNPPYLTSPEMAKLQKEVTFEPHIALYAGADGFEFIKKIIRQAPRYLNKDGKLFLEIGKNHKPKIIEAIDTKIWQNVKILKDFNDFDRYLIAQKNG